jgi:hypothetical protein
MTSCNFLAHDTTRECNTVAINYPNVWGKSTRNPTDLFPRIADLKAGKEWTTCVKTVWKAWPAR